MDFGMSLGLDSLVNGLFSIWSGNRATHAAEDAQKREQAFNAEQAQLNRDWQNEQRILQNEWNLDLWNMNNEYNSLSSQVQRALDAGVNPNLVFGNGAGTASAPAQSSSIGGGAQAQTSSIADTLASIEQNKLRSAADIGKIFAETQGQQLQNKFDAETFNLRKDEIATNIEAMVSNKNLTDIQADTARESLKWLPYIQDATLTNLRNTAAETLQKIANLEADEKLTNLKSELTKTEIDYTIEKTETEDLNQKKLTAETIGIYKDNAMKEFTIQFQAQTGLDPNTSIIPATRKLYGDVTAENLLETALTLFGLTGVGKAAKGVKIGGKLLNHGWNFIRRKFKKSKLPSDVKPIVNGNTITWNLE